MNYLDYQPSFDGLLDAALAKLAESPWDLQTVEELRVIGLQRKASGIPDSAIRKRRMRDKGGILYWYEEMARQPTESEPVIQIIRLADAMAPTLDPVTRDAAERVQVWAERLLKKMLPGRRF